MSQEPNSQRISLPVRREITLCEAVTAIVYGKAMNVVEYMVTAEPSSEAQAAKEGTWVGRLHDAAYAGEIRFRGLKGGGRPSDGHQVIDNLYFSERRWLRWERDELRSKAGGADPTLDWTEVHVDRSQFEEWLSRNELSARSTAPDAELQRPQVVTHSSGAAGRPTSIHLVTPEAKRRIECQDLPETLTEFSRQLSEWLSKTYPDAHPLTAKSIENKIRELWRQRAKANRPT